MYLFVINDIRSKDKNYAGYSNVYRPKYLILHKIVTKSINFELMKQHITEYIENYINGVFQAPLSGQYLENINPATGQQYSYTPKSQQEDVNRAVTAAANAFPTWSKTTKEERFKWLNKIAELIEYYAPDLTLAESIDNGKPYRLAERVDIPRAADNFRFFATAAMHYASEAHLMNEGFIHYTTREPLGVVACISPWNLPLYLFSWKIAPALATGNCVVAKPSEVTPMTAYLLSKIIDEAGLPKGVVNIIHGTGAECGAEMVRHPLVKAISFTGSTRAGKSIAAVAASQFKKYSLELGGKNPNIIFEDCDWEQMIRTTINSSFANQGQICLCGSRILVQRSIYEAFKKDFIAEAKKIVPMDPLNPKARMGAIVSKDHYEKILKAIETAKEEGGLILLGGAASKLDGENSEGYFIPPTIIEGLGPDTLTNQEEIFGPVVTLQVFDTEEEALALANNSNYGLSATVWTQDVSRAHRVAHQLEVGMVWVNTWLLRDLRTPFGGVKQSGVGREGGWYAMDFFTEPKNITIPF